jgi:hypothetical protein
VRGKAWFAGTKPFLYGEFLAALGPTGAQDGAAAAGFHSGAKAVCTDAFDFAGLIGSFHRDPACLGKCAVYKDFEY